MGGGGGGRGSYFPRAKKDLEKLIWDSKKDADRERLDSDVNKLLREVLASCERDPAKVQERLDNIADVIKDEANMERFLFGGSVAKHTYVDGLSDVDALVILNREDLTERSPVEVLDIFHKSLQDRLTYDEVKSLEKGGMAVTVVYRDGMEIQLLPAIRTGPKVIIPSAGSKGWKEIDPKAFQKALAKANERVNCALVPAIKLVKSINAGMPEQKRLTGYHIESLGVEAVKGYRGAKTVKALLTHILHHASKGVLNPIQDVTGQSRIVDAYLGEQNSTKRRVVADALASIVRKLNAATTADHWKAIVED
ncbi:MAG: CBASS oligonucleotide cyclase [Candidatus Hodarchaeota archaeon]